MTDEKSIYPIPSWATKPAAGTHLDVMKNYSLIQKLLIDEKPFYYFLCDFTIEHASSSRVHAVLLFHSVLRKFAMVDLKSSHGTFVNGVKIEPLQPVFMDYNDDFHFGASTRKYVVRPRTIMDDESAGSSAAGEKDFRLPEQQHELENLTNYNTMQNRRVTAIPITQEEAKRKKRPRGNVTFLEAEDVINPEDVDPSVGRFRNLIQTAMVNKGKRKAAANSTNTDATKRRILRPGKDESGTAQPFSSVLGGISISAAPNLDLYSDTSTIMGPTAKAPVQSVSDADDHAHKKYAKEAWPGRKSAHSVI
ncbi:FHA domain-containing protein [Aphelenchoides besseyi]|nr:FHA domain-containing protein [Aphelenchoides besseyi]